MHSATCNCIHPAPVRGARLRQPWTKRWQGSRLAARKHDAPAAEPKQTETPAATAPGNGAVSEQPTGAGASSSSAAKERSSEQPPTSHPIPGKAVEEKPCCASESATTPADEVQTDMQEALAPSSDVPAAEATATAAAATAGSTEQKATQEHASGSKKLRKKLHQAVDPSPIKHNPVTQYLDQHPAARYGAYAAAVFLGSTLLITAFRLLRKYNSPNAKKRRSVNKNLLVVETLCEYLPGKREELDARVAKQIKFKTGFSSVEVFRKYLWYLLRERKFDQEAVDDVVQLKQALALSDEDVADALQERAKRIYSKYGNVMLDVEGMSKAGIERKATARALFSKLLYLAESEQLVAQDSEAVKKVNIPDVFGATEDDTHKLRIVSLTQVDFQKLEAQFDDGDQDNDPDAP